MGIALRGVFVVYVRVSNHWLVDLVQINHHFCEVLGIVIWSQSRVLSRLDFSDTLVSQINKALQHIHVVFHALVDHDLDTALSQFQRLDQGFIVRDTDRGFCLHLCSPVGEGKSLVSK